MKLIIVIFFLGLLLRTFLVGNTPIGFNPDEASFGYDAYSLLKTGRDQWGQQFPLVLKSFGDYKAPLYSYLTIPSVGIFGLTPFAVRLPNAIIGSLAIIAFYLMLVQIFEYEKEKNVWFKSDFDNKKKFVTTISALLFAISPWHIAMSRGAFEANLTTFFIPLGIYYFYNFLNNKKNIYLYSSVLVFGLNLFTYHSAKPVTLVVAAALALLHFSELRKFKKAVRVSIILIIILSAVTIYTYSIGAGSRAADVSIYKLALSEASAERIRAFNNGLPDGIGRIFHNKIQVFVKNAAGNYLSYLSPQFLFVRGAGERTYGMNDNRGVLYWFELPLLIFFLVWLARNKVGKPLLAILIWFLVSPIAASLAVGPGYAANRAVVMLPSIHLFLGFGAYILVDYILNFKIFSKYIAAGYVIIAFAFFIAFLENYFFVTPSKIAKDMLYGNLGAAQFLRGSTRQIVVSRKISEPHIYIAFANKINPNAYQENVREWKFAEAGLDWVDQMGEYRLNNYVFKNIDYQLWKDKDAILIGRPEEFPETVVPVKRFADPSGNDLIYVVDTQSTYYAQSDK